MADTGAGPLRLWDGDRHAPITALAACELLRPNPRTDDLSPPYLLQWFLELESRRYSRQGRWIPALLEFEKHRGERILGLGSDLGSDWVQYARHGAEVVVCHPLADRLALVKRNFELRGLRAGFVQAEPAALPIESASVDVVSLTSILHASVEPERVIDEVFRVLKPGGKVLAVAPALRDLSKWWSFWEKGVQGQGGQAALVAGPLSPHARRFGTRQLRQVFERFSEIRIYRRHLRRAEVPHLWRWLPMPILERLGGRFLVLKALKPLTARTYHQAAA